MNRLFLGGLLMMAGIGLGSWTPPAHAEAYDILEMTPSVNTALNNRRARFDQLGALKQQGVLGENNRGYVEILSGSSAALKALVEAENADRRVIYETVVEQNGLPASALNTIEEVFAEVLRTKALSGDKIQNPDGTWVTKP